MSALYIGLPNYSCFAAVVAVVVNVDDVVGVLMQSRAKTRSEVARKLWLQLLLLMKLPMAALMSHSVVVQSLRL